MEQVNFKQELVALMRLLKPGYAEYFGLFGGGYEEEGMNTMAFVMGLVAYIINISSNILFTSLVSLE